METEPEPANGQPVKVVEVRFPDLNGPSLL